MDTELREVLANIDPDLILWDGFDEAVIGLGIRCGLYVVAYDLDKMIHIMMERDNMTYEEAMEYYEFNIAGAYIGEKTPIVIDNFGFKD